MIGRSKLNLMALCLVLAPTGVLCVVWAALGGQPVFAPAVFMLGLCLIVAVSILVAHWSITLMKRVVGDDEYHRLVERRK
jgi:hypothetical protein